MTLSIDSNDISLARLPKACVFKPGVPVSAVTEIYPGHRFCEDHHDIRFCKMNGNDPPPLKAPDVLVDYEDDFVFGWYCV